MINQKKKGKTSAFKNGILNRFHLHWCNSTDLNEMTTLKLHKSHHHLSLPNLSICNKFSLSIQQLLHYPKNPVPKTRFLLNWLKMTRRNAFLSNIYYWIINISTERSESNFISKTKKKTQSFCRLSIISLPENYLMVIVHFWRQLYGTYLTRNTKKIIYPSFPRKFEFSPLRMGRYCNQATWMYLNYNLNEPSNHWTHAHKKPQTKTKNPWR